MRESVPPAPPPRPPLEYVGEWGTRGDGPGQLTMPVSITTDSVGNVYIADVGSRFLHKFDPNGKPLLSFQDPLMTSPSQVAVDLGGAIYVADFRGNRVLIFFPDGERFRVLRGGPGRPFRGPGGVAVADGGNIYVTESESRRVQAFTAQRRPLWIWTNAGDPSVPTVAMGFAATSPDGWLHVGGLGVGRVFQFSPSGELAGVLDLGEDVTFVAGMVVTDAHVIAAVNGDKVGVWTRRGERRFLDDLGGRLKKYEANRAMGVALGRNRELLVLDAGGARVLRFRINF